jgi:hypothetical protein
MMGAVPGQSTATPQVSVRPARENGGSTVLTTSSARSAIPPVLVVLAAACVLLTGAVVLAGPAAAIEDLRRPTAEMTHGPSCGPGVVRIAVTNGNQPRRVALVFDGTSEQASALLAPGEPTELVSEDIAWGRTVDVSVVVADADGTAADPIEFGTYTRPSAEDCAAISARDAAAPDPSSGADAGRTPDPVSADWPTGPARGYGSTAGESLGHPDDVSAASVPPGGVVTVHAGGFTPGEPVTVSMIGVDEPLTTLTAAADGSVETVVQIPRGAAVGAATVRLVGTRSAATAGMDLLVAARIRPVQEQTTSVPVLAAGTALIGVAGVLGRTAGRRPRRQD